VLTLGSRSDAAHKAWLTRKRGKPSQIGKKFKTGRAPSKTERKKKKLREKVVGRIFEQLNGHDRYRHQWMVPSRTDPTKKYKVSVRDDGVWMCSCPAWRFQKGPIENRKPCAHIRSIVTSGALGTIKKHIEKRTPVFSKRASLTISQLSGLKLKEDIGFSRATKRYHNKHKDGSGNFGFTLVKDDAWFNLSGDYDSKGNVWSLGFGKYSEAPSPITARDYRGVHAEILERMRRS